MESSSPSSSGETKCRRTHLRPSDPPGVPSTVHNRNKTFSLLASVREASGGRMTHIVFSQKAFSLQQGCLTLKHSVFITAVRLWGNRHFSRHLTVSALWY